MSDQRNPRRIKSLERAFDIVEFLRAEGGATVSEIADMVDLSPGTVSTYMATMKERGYVERKDGEFQLSLFFLPIGEHVRLRSDIYKGGKPVVDELAVETGEVVHLMTENQGHEIQVYGRLGSDAVGEQLYTENKTVPKRNLHCSAAGKAIVAHMKGSRRDMLLLDYEFIQRTPNTITDIEHYRAELEEIRSEGVAFNDEEQVTGLRAVAAPITLDTKVLGAITLASPVSRLRGERFRSEFPNKVREAANIIEVNIQTSSAEIEY